MGRLWYSTKFELLDDSEYWMNILIRWKRNTAWDTVVVKKITNKYKKVQVGQIKVQIRP